VTTSRCDHWQGLQAARAVGQLAPSDAPGLVAHLAVCPSCSAAATELAGVAAALALADPDHLGDGDDVPERLLAEAWERIDAEERVRAEQWARAEKARTVRRRVARRWAAAGVVTAAAAAVVVAVVVSRSPAPASRTVDLVGPGGARASVELIAQPSGTRVVLREAGQRGSQVMTVSMASSSGTWWVAGSYRTAAGGGPVQVVLSCALPADRVARIWVVDGSGRTVLGTAPGY
jgi:hypothetical protein